MEGLTRGQLAQRAQINLETVRFYEQEGLLAPPSRTASGYRKFAEAAVDRLAFVILDWLGFYNAHRLHSTLGYVSPMTFEKNWLASQWAA